MRFLLPTNHRWGVVLNMTTVLLLSWHRLVESETFECGFENGLCGMELRSEGDLTWIRRNWSTPSDHTGPASAKEGLYYIYTEASVGNNSDKAYISTPALDHSGPLCISFRYHLYGFHIGRLKVFMEKDGEDRPIFSETKSNESSGDDDWHYAQLIVNATVSGDKVVFLGVYGGGVYGDMALDDVTVNNDGCFKGSRCSTCEQLCGLIDNNQRCLCYGGHVLPDGHTFCPDIQTTASTAKPTTPTLAPTTISPTATPTTTPIATTPTTTPTTTTPTTTPITTTPTTTPITTPTRNSTMSTTTPSAAATTTPITPKVSSLSSRAAANTPRPSTTPRALTPRPTTTRQEPTMAQEGDTEKSGDGTGRGNQQDINMAGLAGGVVGGLVLLALIPVVIYLVLRFKRNDDDEVQRPKITQRLKSFAQRLKVKREKNVMPNSGGDDVEAHTPHTSGGVDRVEGDVDRVEVLQRTTLKAPPPLLHKPSPVSERDRATAAAEDEEEAQMDPGADLRQNISSDDFPSYVAAKLASDGFSAAFKRILTPSLSCKEALEKDLKSKNRFKNILPFDKNRVKLSKCDGDPLSDYINASFIKLYKEDETFIASVGPIKSILDDFWRLIWEQSVAVIVMLTNLVEAGTMKCEQYWPCSGSHKFGSITVHLVSEEKWPDYVIRNFRLEVKTGDTTFKARPIKQLHFTSWPDFGVPQDATAILRFHRKMRKYMFRHKPTLIHCSAGVGRTGTFMAIDHLLHQLEDEGAVGVYECVTNLRAQRQHMVQSESQYRFIHEALVEAITLGTTTVSAKQFKDCATDERTAKEYQALEYMTTSMTEEDKKLALSKDNKTKNVSGDVIPRLSRRSILISRMKGRNDYINAVFAHAYQRKDAFIVTQTPLENTEVDFWRLLHDYRAGTVVILDPQRASYLPNTKQRDVSHEPYSITLTTRPEEATDNIIELSFDVIKLDVKHDGSTGETDPKYQNSARGSSTQDEIKGDAVSCRVFHLVAERYTDLTSAMLSDLFTLVTTAHTAAPDTPVVLVSRDGAELCGMVVVFFCLLEMIQKEPEVDIFYMVKQARDSRPQFIASQAQYKYMYMLIEDYLIHADKKNKFNKE